MNMDQNPENVEFVREFAEDCKEIIHELSGFLEILQNQQDVGAEVPARTSEQIYRNLAGIQSSAEFLDLGPVHQLCLAMSSFFEKYEHEDHLYDRREVDTFASVLGCLTQFIHQLAEKGFLDDVQSEVSLIVTMIHELSGGEAVASSQETPAAENASFISPSEDVPLDAFQIQITPEMMATFITEAEEQLEEAESALLNLEKNLSDREALNTAFRGIHTLKGNAGLFNFSQLEKLGHELESILENYKSSKFVVERKGISMLLKVLDALKATIDTLPDGDGKVADFDDLLRMLLNYQTKGHVEMVHQKGDSTMLGEILIEMGALDRDSLDQALSRQGMPVGELLRESGMIAQGDLNSALKIQLERRVQRDEGTTRKRSSAQNIRVDLYKLDSLMNLVGELIIAENIVTNNPDLEGYDFQNFKKASLQLNRISRELQDISLSLRMIPIEATFHRMVRVVRDVSHKQGKEVELEMSGEDTEVDKSVVESLAGPLLHIIRNAIDHGIESPDERERLGKARIGTINLRAFHEGGEVVIEIQDDGKGIDPEQILKKAREKGLVPDDQEFLNIDDVYQLIFMAGFSTAEQVTDISGRGVGMDVVKKNIDEIKGRVNISSHLGEGTIFRIRIPLTLAIIEGMLTRVGDQLFTVPLLSIRESLRAHASWISHTVDGTEMVRIRERLVPVVRLHDLFNTTSDHTDLTKGILVVVDHERKQLCLFVDEIMGQYQTVIKGLSNFLGSVRGISGSSIMSNGDISLILDIPSLVSFALAKNRDM